MKGKKVKIVKLQKNTGEHVKFSGKQKIMIQAGKIVGSASDREYSIKLNELEKISKDKKGNINHITTKDGRSFYVMSAREEGERIIFSASDFAQIPLSEVNILWVRKTNTLLSVLAVLTILSLMSLAMGGPMAGVSFFDEFPLVINIW